MSEIYIKQLELGPMGNFTYLVGDPKKMLCAVIDPGWEPAKIIKAAEKDGYKISAILLTHTHFDHARALHTLAKETGASVYLHSIEADEIALDEKKTFKDGDEIHVGGLGIKVLHTPGHSPGSSCFLVDKAMFTGDTLFDGAIGRTDLPGGDPEAMFESLARLSKMQDGIIIYPGHNYGSQPASTLGEQKKTNPYMRMRSVRDLL